MDILFSYRCVTKTFPVAMRCGETPVPIPNTMVKTQAADGTTLETVWESRWPPASIWGCSSVGRAPALQAGGQEFESLHLHEGNEPCTDVYRNRQTNLFGWMLVDTDV